MNNRTIEYEAFKTRLLNTLRTELGDGISVHTREISGSGASALEACSISIPGRKLCPVFYPSYFYEKYKGGSSFAEIMENIKDSIRFSSDDSFDQRDIVDYSIAKGHIIPKLVNQKTNSEWLAHVAHTTYLDLAVTFIYVIRSEGDELVSFTVGWEQLADWKVTVEMLLRDSIRTAQRLFPLSIQTIEDVLGLSNEDYYQTFYVMSNSRRHYGAACILYDHALSDFAERIGDSFHIIPSSVHEVLLVSDSLGIPADELQGMLGDVNISIVRSDEVLSDKVYYYDRRTGSLEIVDRDMRLVAAQGS